MMGIMLNESTYFFQAVEAPQMYLIWWKCYTTPYQKHCFVNVKTQKSRVLWLEPTGMSAANIGGNTIHSDLGIKPGIKLLGLKDKSKVTLRNKIIKGETFNNRWTFYGIKWLIDRY